MGGVSMPNLWDLESPTLSLCLWRRDDEDGAYGVTPHWNL